MMQNKTDSRIPFWILPQLWGFDVPVVVLLWSLICLAHLQITMITEGPVLLVAVVSWVCTIFSRVYNAVRYKEGWYSRYYESRAVPMLMMAASAGMAALWMFLYFVGRHVLFYGVLPIFFAGCSCLFSFMRLKSASGLFKGLALGFTCMVPAYCLSFLMGPLHMLGSAPCWYLGVLFFIFVRERFMWQADPAGRFDISNVMVVGLFALLVVNALSSVEAPLREERSLFITVVTAAACLMVLAKMRPNLKNEVLFAISWPVMALPPLLGLLLFPPGFWGPPMF